MQNGEVQQFEELELLRDELEEDNDELLLDSIELEELLELNSSHLRIKVSG